MNAIQIESSVRDLAVGVVDAQALTIAPASAELRKACADAVQRVLHGGMSGGETRREAVRKLLRAGGFKPAGRNKPAQEYLLRTATESAELPAIFNAVDWLNAISLEAGLPISLLAANKLGSQSFIRYGRPAEKFVFNRAGQELELEGLICVCSQEGENTTPLGTPIKDSMAGKISAEDANVVAVIYAPRSNVTSEELFSWARKLAEGFREWCGAAAAEHRVIGCE